jgi:acyl transferase domain-containing protein
VAPTDGRRISSLANITLTSPPEPAAIAITGMGCRFPGGLASPATYWDFLTADGGELVDIPGDRWLVDKSLYAPGASAPGLSRVRRGSFLTLTGERDQT